MQEDAHIPAAPTPIVGTFRIEAPGNAVEKRVTIRGERIHIRVDYEDGAVIEWTIGVDGAIEIDSNRMYVIDAAQRTIRVLGRMVVGSSPPKDSAPASGGRYHVGRGGSAPTEPALPAQSVDKPRRV